MIRRFATTALIAATLGLAAQPALADTDGEVTTSLLATLYAPGTETAGHDAAREFYATQDYLPVWWRDGAWTDAAREAVVALGEVRRDGLDPARYAHGILQSAVSDDLATMGGPSAVARTELALTEAVLALIDDRAGGLTSPADFTWNTRTQQADAVARLDRGLESADFGVWLRGVMPPRENAYARLLPHLERQRLLAREPWPEIADGATLRIGDSDERVPALRRRLVRLGDLEGRASRLHPGAAAETYDATLAAAVAAFQTRHGLAVDGIVGPNTLAALNVTPGERVTTLLANLERLRWMPGTAALPERHVEINIASQELVARESGRVALSMPVIVGEPANPTPLLSDRIVNLKFAPDWTVPFGIAKKEMLPKIRQDPSWLVRNDYVVYADWGRGPEVDPLSIAWDRVTPSNWSYMIQQQPSASSALGLVRFSLTNDMDIFLHDTGARHLFGRNARALSHGCVRVGNPDALAAFALRGEDEPWDATRIAEAMNAAETSWERLDEPVAVDFVYLTAWVDDAGRLQFRPDIYDLDTAVVTAASAAAEQPAVTLPLMIGEGGVPPDGLTVSGLSVTETSGDSL